MISWFRREIVCPLQASRNGKPYRHQLVPLRQELDLVLDPDARSRVQFERCKWILEHAYAHSAFYRAHFDAAGFTPEQFRSISDLQSVPVFEKHHIIGNQEAIRADNVAASDLVPTATGGTTGNSFPFQYVRAWNDAKQ